MTHCETWFDVKLVETWMHAQDTYALVIVCMSARKKAPVNCVLGEPRCISQRATWLPMHFLCKIVIYNIYQQYGKKKELM